MSQDDARLVGYQRGGSANEQFRYLRGNSEQELLTSQGLPPYTELSRRGRGWQVIDTTATAAVVVRPSTVAGLTLYNGETGATAKSYVIDRVGAFNLVSTAALSDWSIWACIHPAGMTAPTADITAIKGMNGSTYAGSAIVDTGATVNDNGWFPVGGGRVTHGVGVTPTSASVVEIGGRLIVPATGGLSINVVGSITGLTFTHFISWFEVELDLD